MYSIEDVFRPASYPTYTYINRKFDRDNTYESKLKRALRSSGRLISITGASKTGKTVLCHSVIDDDKIIDLSGAQIQAKDDFWNQIAEKISIPAEIQTTTTLQDSTSRTLQGNASLKLPFTASGALNLQGGKSHTSGINIAEKEILSTNTITSYLIKHNKVLVIDDFHYIADELQLYIARILKDALFKGLKAILLSLPHRADDAVKHNPDLIGRTTFINISAWQSSELAEIARKGFALLNYKLNESDLNLLTQESITSPQLMQQNCLNLAYNISDVGRQSASQELVLRSFKDTVSDYTNYDDILEQVLRGPAQGRSRRKHYLLAGETEKADIYMMLLRAVSEDPPVLSFELSDIQSRLHKLLSPKEIMPRPLSISGAVVHMEAIMKKASKLDTVEWKRQRLYILDPFLLFYLRWSDEWKHFSNY